MRSLFWFGAFLIAIFAQSGEEVEITIKGSTTCNRKTMATQKVKLYKWARGGSETLPTEFSSDDLLASTESGSNGGFELKIGNNRTENYIPVLRFTHTCNMKQWCFRRQDVVLPIKDKAEWTDFDMTFVPLDYHGYAAKDICND
ncbi:unnamed protein product, partial [Mesorhabditis belari]|uniref:Uncharacterized protein n=1 Tax=Mesorhabditis belari TaxID=2138241 RepID=A0AAF3FBA0_9BILA